MVSQSVRNFVIFSVKNGHFEDIIPTKLTTFRKYMAEQEKYCHKMKRSKGLLTFSYDLAISFHSYHLMDETQVFFKKVRLCLDGTA